MECFRRCLPMTDTGDRTQEQPPSTANNGLISVIAVWRHSGQSAYPHVQAHGVHATLVKIQVHLVA
jgi:hypothetical protein